MMSYDGKIRALCLVLVTASLLASCDNGSQNDKSGSRSANSSAESSIANDQSAPSEDNKVKFGNPLPGGVSFSFPYSVRLDIPAPNKDGTEGRRVEFEYFGGDAVQAMQQVAEAMKKAGFVSRDAVVQDGVVRQVFGREDAGVVNVRAETGAEGLVNPGASGFVVMAWSRTEPGTTAPIK